MNEIRTRIERMLETMTVGQSLAITADVFEEAYPGRPAWLDAGWSPRDTFMSSRMGSGWGTWECRVDGPNRKYIITRGRETNRRVYVEPDRRHLFVEVNGELVPRHRPTSPSEADG